MKKGRGLGLKPEVTNPRWLRLLLTPERPILSASICEICAICDPPGSCLLRTRRPNPDNRTPSCPPRNPPYGGQKGAKGERNQAESCGQGHQGLPYHFAPIILPDLFGLLFSGSYSLATHSLATSSVQPRNDANDRCRGLPQRHRGHRGGRNRRTALPDNRQPTTENRLSTLPRKPPLQRRPEFA